MNEIELWKMFASLGVPGVALGVFYFLFRKFNFKLPQVPVKWVGPIVVLFMLLSSSLTFYALTLWSPENAQEKAQDIPVETTDEVSNTDSTASQLKETPSQIKQDTSGDKSPAVSNVNGDVKIEINGD